MESFVHLRKGRTPKRLHADLDGLKDDELGRGGFTGRTANIYRRNDPTAYRSVGLLRPLDVLSSELKPSDATDANGGPLLLFSNADCLVSLSRRAEPMPFFVRYVDGDLLSFVPLLMEKVVEDRGECIKDARNRLGYEKVVLAGWSGGGSLSVFYQQQAQHPTLTASPSGDGPDLTKLGLIPAEGIMLLAAHISRYGTMTEWLDASILDESDPSNRDPELDLYNPDNPNQPPYTAEFLDRYREAQIARNRRITKWVKEKLAKLSEAGRPDDEFGFVVHGTMADPRWLDPTVDPNERTPGTCYLGDPRVVNMSPVGLARFCTLRSWLSQWSYDDANGDAVQCGPDIAVPALVIGNLADDVCTPSHTRRLFEAIGHPDKEMHEIPGANHYYSGPAQRDTLRKAVGICTDWLHRHGLSSEGSAGPTPDGQGTTGESTL
jgi:pimeloyl-ACP methyl ester carboxylesterase